MKMPIAHSLTHHICSSHLRRQATLNMPEESGMLSTRAASANQNVTVNIPHEKPEKLPPCLPHNTAKDWCIQQSIEIRDDARSLMTRDTTVITGSKLQSCECWNQTEIIVCSTSQHSTTEIIVYSTNQHSTTWEAGDSKHRVLHKSTQYHRNHRVLHKSTQHHIGGGRLKTSCAPQVNTVPQKSSCTPEM